MTQLAKYDAACQAVAEAKDIDEAKDLRDKAEAMRAYARQAKNKHLEIDAAEIRMRAERRVGQLIQEQKATVGLATGGQPYQSTGSQAAPVEKPPTLAEAGIDKKLSSRAQKLAAVPEAEFEGAVGEWRERVGRETERVTVNLLKAGSNAMQMSTGNEWYTPAKYINAARTVMGGIDLDPASCAAANETVGAVSFYDITDDGLGQAWRGRVWLNPPYGGSAGEFVKKLLDEMECGRVVEAIVLVNSNTTDTNWFQPLWNHALCFTDHRIDFDSPHAKDTSSTHGSVFIYLGGNRSLFSFEFGRFGAVVAKI